MSRTIRGDGSVSLSSGASHSTRQRSHVRVQFLRYNYITYSRLGSNLDDSFLGFLSGLMNPRSARDFSYIEPNAPNSLAALFNVRNRRSIQPTRFRQYTSTITNRWIYFFIDDGPGTLIELEYREDDHWAAGVYDTSQDGNRWEEVNTYSSNENQRLFTLDRRLLSATYAIALPSRVFPETALNIIMGRSERTLANVGPTRNLCRLIPVSLPEGTRGVDMRMMIFDPGHLIKHSVEVAEYHTRLMGVVDARHRFRRLSRWERRIRKRGILACLMKQLVDSDSSLENEVHQRTLDRAFNRYANYGFRKAYFLDNLYNFLTHPIMERLEECLMIHRVDNKRIDGRAWLEMISPLAEIAGDHTLIANYFNVASENEPNESAWATFFKSSVETGTAREDSTVATWNSMMGQDNYINLAVGLAEVVTYKLVRDYSGGSITWEQFEDFLSSKRTRLDRIFRGLGRSRRVTVNLRKVSSAFTWGRRLGQVAAALKGDVSASTLTTALGALQGLTDARKAAALAARIAFIVNAIDVVGNAADFADRFSSEDYDAAAAYGVAIAAGVTEMAFIYAYGAAALSGGPAGIVLAIIGVLAAIIASLVTDSELERFASHCMWGRDNGDSRTRPSWSSTRFSEWNDTDIGVEFQLEALINLLHRYEVRHKFDDDTNVIAIEIETKFLPETAIFAFYGQLETSSGETINFNIYVRQPSRNPRRRSRLFSSRSGRSVIRGGNAYVETDDGVHTLKINIGVRSNVSGGRGWIVCFPFGHREFRVPDGGRGFFLDNVVEDRYTWADLDFEPDSFRDLPG